jgi:hypothetical protein
LGGAAGSRDTVRAGKCIYQRHHQEWRLPLEQPQDEVLGDLFPVVCLLGQPGGQRQVARLGGQRGLAAQVLDVLTQPHRQPVDRSVIVFYARPRQSSDHAAFFFLLLLSVHARKEARNPPWNPFPGSCRCVGARVTHLRSAVEVSV